MDGSTYAAIDTLPPAERRKLRTGFSMMATGKFTMNDVFFF